MASNSTLCLSGAAPVPLSPNICNPGFYCPNNTAEHPPVYCPPTEECIATRLLTFHNICPVPQGVYEPIVCSPGYYCPPGGREQTICPSGHYCPLGSVRPFKCRVLSWCAEGSDRQVPFLGLLLCGILDLFLICVLQWPRMRNRGRRDDEENNNKNNNNNRRSSQGMGVELQPTPTERHRVEAFLQDDLNMRLELEFRDVSLRRPRSNGYILSEISGKAHANSLTGIMGQSGSGKTTLVNILTGKMQASSGTLLLNGAEKKLTERHNFAALMGFVPQEDVVHPHLTVWENVLHSARIRLGGVLEDDTIQKHASDVIDNLGLGRVKNQVVGTQQRRVLSGGERKRVSIALELVARPQVLVLDEPTSGLDAQAALSIMGLLRSLSRKGITVICVIHQPRVEIFEALDGLILLEQGRRVYCGQAGEAKDYFQRQGYSFSANLNPADLIMDIISGNLHQSHAPMTESKRGELSYESGESVLLSGTGAVSAALHSFHDLEKRYQNRIAPWHRQAYLCFMRDLTQQSRQIAVLVAEIMAGVVTGVLSGLAMYELHGHLFQGLFLPPFTLLSSAINYSLIAELGLLGCLCINFAAAAPSVNIFGEEIFVFQRESHSGHSESAYFVGKVLSCLPRCFLAAVHFTTFVAVLSTPAASFNTLLGLNMLYFYCVYGIGSIVAAVTSRENGPLVCLLATIVMGVFSGSLPRLPVVRGWHLEWLWYMSPGIWYTEAFISAHITPFAYLYDLRLASTETGFTFSRIGFDVGLLLLIGSVFRGIGCVLMVIRVWSNWW